MNSKTQNNLLSIMLLLISLVWISAVSTAHASVGANPNAYTTKIVMDRLDGLKENFYEASQISGFDMADLVAISSLETTLRGNVKSRFSSAAGLVQYTKGTWKQDVGLYAKQLGLSKNVDVYNVRANLLIGSTALYNLKELLIEKSHLTEETLRVGDLYMSHLVGTNGAIAIINSNSNTPISKVITLHKGNYSMYHKPNGQVRTAREFRLHMQYLVKRERTFYEKKVRHYQLVKSVSPYVDSSPMYNAQDNQIGIAIANSLKIAGYDVNS